MLLQMSHLCVLGTTVNCAKMAGPIDVLFGVWPQECQTNHVSDGVQIFSRELELLRGDMTLAPLARWTRPVLALAVVMDDKLCEINPDCLSAMQPFTKLLWTLAVGRSSGLRTSCCLRCRSLAAAFSCVNNQSVLPYLRNAALR